MTKSETRHTNHKSERIDKMENINVMEIVLYEIDIIAKEQLMIVKYNIELDDRRLRLMEFVKNSEKLQISTEARPETIFSIMFQIWN